MTAITGTTVWTSSLPTAAQLSRSNVRASTAWNTIPVTVIATSPDMRRTANGVESHLSPSASINVATPTSRFDWVVKNANALAARAAAGWKWPLALLAAVVAEITTPTSTHAVVAPNQIRAPLGDIEGI